MMFDPDDFAERTYHLSPAEQAARVMQDDYAAEIKRLRALVQRAYNEGFLEGMREYTSYSGGKSWAESSSRKVLEGTP